MAADIRRGSKVCLGAETFVHPNQGQEAIRIVLETAFLAERFERRARGFQIVAHFADPGIGQHGQFVNVSVFPLVLLRKLLAASPPILRSSGQKQPKRFFKFQMRHGLARKLYLADGHELAGAAFGILRQVQNPAQVHEGHFVVGGTSMDLRPAQNRLRELATDVLDFGE
jgi:hypothetical protein